MTIPARVLLSWRTAWLAMSFATVLLLPPIARAQTTISVTATFTPLAYYFDGGSANAAITLTRGRTYIFSLQGSVLGHPFRIQTVTGSTSGTLYPGVTNNGAQSGNVTFSVPLDAPDTLYYQCGVHFGMAGTINIVNAPMAGARVWSDFDGDGKADILWRNISTGENYIWLMNGLSTASQGSVNFVDPASGWQVKGIGDFDGDGKADIVWRNSTSGENYLYPMDGTTIKPTRGSFRTVADLAWQIVAVGDYDGDGKADVLWRHATSGENYLYPMDGTAIKASEGYLRSVPQPNWQIQNPPLPPPTPTGTVVTLMPVADNTLYESASGDLSNGAGMHLYVGRTNQVSASVRRAVLKFDLSSIPATSTINAATLMLHMSRTTSAGQGIAVRRLLANWGEGTSNATGGLGEGGGGPATTNDATWVHRFYSTQLWNTPGGDFAAAASATTTVSDIGNYSWSGAGVTADVQQWLANPAANFGWLVRGSEATGATSKQFDSRENPTAAFRPTLTVDFTAPQPQ